MSADSLRSHPAAGAFVSTAQRYCTLLEHPIRDRELWLADVLTTLAALYAAAPILRDVPLPDENLPIPQEFKLTNDEWTVLYTHLRHALGNDALYSAQFNPLIPPSLSATTPVQASPPSSAALDADTPTGDLADDLADIYRDLRPGLTAWNTQDDRFLEDILFQWVHYGHIHHWGRHAVNALRALHWLVYS